MILVHLILAISTFGIWLGLVIIWKVLNAKIGGWKCSELGLSGAYILKTTYLSVSQALPDRPYL